jgi:hypothetical protein
MAGYQIYSSLAYPFDRTYTLRYYEEKIWFQQLMEQVLKLVGL